MLETVPAVVVEALAVGAAAGMSDTAKQVILDAYTHLKNLVATRYSQVDIDAVTQQPASVTRRVGLVERLEASGAGDDAELLAAARSLLTAVQTHAAPVAEAVGVDLCGIRATALRIEDVTSARSGVVVKNSTIDGPIDISGVDAGAQAVADPPGVRR